jgi:hypothetical protein
LIARRRSEPATLHPRPASHLDLAAGPQGAAT